MFLQLHPSKERRLTTAFESKSHLCTLLSNSSYLCYSVEYTPKPLLCVSPLSQDQDRYCLTYCKHHWGAPGLPRARSHPWALSPSPDKPFSLRPPRTLLVPYNLKKSPWFLNQISPSKRWRWNRLNFVNTEEKPWVVNHTWPHVGADQSIHRETLSSKRKTWKCKKGAMK